MAVHLQTLRARTVEVPSLDPLAALAGPGEAPVAFWEVPARGESWAAFGTAWESAAADRESALELLRVVSRPDAVPQDGGPRPPGPFAGGMGFDLSRAPGEAWSGFPVALWRLPRRILWRRAGRCFATAVAPEGELDGASRAAAALADAAAGRGSLVPGAWGGEAVTLSVGEDRAGWDRAMARALLAIERGEVRKVVLARAIDVLLPAPPDLPELLARLREGSPAALTFFFQGDGAAFVGATPETLCRLSGRELETEALAGSAPRGDEASLRREKESREHREVVGAIREALAPLCEWLEISGRGQVVSVPSLLHRRTPISGVLREGAGLAEVVEALHPTPAVGGAPREAALALIREVEGLDRGWYAGLVGTAGPEGAELRVALRVALVRGASARLYVGAGVVRGSTADGEWRETAAKASAVLRALGEREE